MRALITTVDILSPQRSPFFTETGRPHDTCATAEDALREPTPGSGARINSLGAPTAPLARSQLQEPFNSDAVQKATSTCHWKVPSWYRAFATKELGTKLGTSRYPAGKLLLPKSFMCFPTNLLKALTNIDLERLALYCHFQTNLDACASWTTPYRAAGRVLISTRSSMLALAA